jgi:hypothetical protein
MVDEKKPEAPKAEPAKAEPEPAKTEVQKAEEKQAEAVDKVNKQNADIVAASAASGDAEVHRLLGERAVAEQNQDTDALKEIDKQLGGLVK